MEVVEDPLGELRGDLRHRRQLGDRRVTDAARGAERLQEARPDRRSDAGDRVEHRLDRALRPELLVVGDREAVRLVPDALERVERGRRRIEDERVQAVGLVHLLGLFREPDGRDVIEPEILEHLERDVELAAATVDQDEIGQHAPLLERLREASREHLAHRGEVVGAGDGPDAEALVVVLLEAAILPDDHRADLLRSLYVGDVVSLDAVREAGQAQRALELLENELLAVVAGEEATSPTSKEPSRSARWSSGRMAASRRTTTSASAS